MDIGLNELLDSWVAECGKWQVSKVSGKSYFAIDKRSRAKDIERLIQRIHDLGQPKDFFNSSTVEKILNKALPSAKQVSSGLRKSLAAQTRDEIKLLVQLVYKSEREFNATSGKGEEFDPAKHGRMAPEFKPKGNIGPKLVTFENDPFLDDFYKDDKDGV